MRPCTPLVKIVVALGAAIARMLFVVSVAVMVHEEHASVDRHTLPSLPAAITAPSGAMVMP
jgi:hypothetical protein